MARFYGIIGYAVTAEVTETITPEGDEEPFEKPTGVWVDNIIEKSYTGELVRNRRNLRSNDNVNPDVFISDTISVIADGFMLSNVYSMKYVKWRNATWMITNIVIEPPRVVFEIGGLYSGQTL
jgi:hypothetical protein